MSKEILFDNYLRECESICNEYQSSISKIKNSNKDFFKLEQKEFKKELRDKLSSLYCLNNKLKSYENLLKNL